VTFIEGGDRGGATGYAMGSFSEDTPFRLHSARTFSPGATKAQIRDWQFARTGTIRVVEGFQLRASNNFTADLTGVHLIGAMEFADFLGWCDPPIVWQMPADKAHVHDDILKRSGLWRQGGEVGWHTGRHANDAIIHILKFLKVTLKHEPTIAHYWGNR
jgi:hypothetical protein